MVSTLVILGSHRNPSHTRDFLEAVFAGALPPVADLMKCEIAPYGYSAVYPEHDDFFRLVNQLLLHDRLIFATPVYWYAMSGRMKNFFDRLTDLVTTRKETGRQLRGKTVFVLVVGADAGLPAGFLVPFASTAAYFGMHFGGSIYACSKASTFPKEYPEAMRLFRLAVAKGYA